MHGAGAVLAGALAGVVSYGILIFFQSPWSEGIAAFLIGLATALPQRSPDRAAIAALTCTAGWLLGSLVYGVWMDLGVGAWLFAGAALGFAASQTGPRRLRPWIGLALGLVAGAFAEVARYAAVVVESWHGVDMQLLLLLAAGLLLGTATALMAPRGGPS